MTTARDLIEDAFHDLDASEAESSIENFDAQFAFRQMRRMMSSFRLSPEMGWTTPSNLDATLTISPADEEFVQTALAVRIAPSYDVPVSAGLSATLKQARIDVFSRHLRLSALTTDLPLPNGKRGYMAGYSGDRNAVEYGRTFKTVSSDYTVVLADDLILVDCSNGPVTLTFPAASSAGGYGFEVQKADESLNQVIILPNGSDSIEGDSDYRFNERISREFVSDGGSNWRF